MVMQRDALVLMVVMCCFHRMPVFGFVPRHADGPALHTQLCDRAYRACHQADAHHLHDLLRLLCTHGLHASGHTPCHTIDAQHMSHATSYIIHIRHNPNNRYGAAELFADEIPTGADAAPGAAAGAAETGGAAAGAAADAATGGDAGTSGAAAAAGEGAAAGAGTGAVTGAGGQAAGGGAGGGAQQPASTSRRIVWDDGALEQLLDRWGWLACVLACVSFMLACMLHTWVA